MRRIGLAVVLLLAPFSFEPLAPEAQKAPKLPRISCLVSLLPRLAATISAVNVAFERMSRFNDESSSSSLVAIAALGAPRTSIGQTHIARVLVYTGSMAWRDGIASGLRDLGWIEGQTVVIEWRHRELLEDATVVEELGRLHPDVAVLGGP
jgi:hypothetical protein